MSKYVFFNGSDQVAVEADNVAFNLDYGMIFFNKDDEVIASCPTTMPFYKIKDKDAGTD